MKHHKNHNGVIEPAKTDWVAVGDASRFLVFEKKKGKPFAPVKTFNNEKARVKTSDLVGDQPGRSFDSYTRSNGSHQTATSRHAYTSQQLPKEHAVESFAREVTAFLDKAYSEHSFDRLVLVADSRLLGKLRSCLDKTTQSAVSAEYLKDFAWVTGKALEDRIESLMALH